MSRLRSSARAGQAVCGDEVDCEYDALHQELRVVALAPRSSSLYRSNARGKSEPVAANLSLLAIVVAPIAIDYGRSPAVRRLVHWCWIAGALCTAAVTSSSARLGRRLPEG